MKLAHGTSRYRRLLLERVRGPEELEKSLSEVRLALDGQVYRPLLSSLAGRSMLGLWLFLAGVLGALALAAGLGCRRLGKGGGSYIYLPTLAMTLFLAFGQGLTGCDAGPAAKTAVHAENPAQGPAALLAGDLRSSRLVCQALCQLAGKAAQVLPDLAKSYLEEAFFTLERMPRQKALDLARRQPGEAQNLAALASQAWPYALVCVRAQKVDRALGRRVLEAGLLRAAGNPDRLARDWDLRALALSVARHRPGKARDIADDIRDPLVRALCLFGLARASGRADDLERGLKAALEIESPRPKALALASAGDLVARLSPVKAPELFGRAMHWAEKEPDPVGRQWLSGQAAALLAEAAPELAVKKALELEEAPGAGFKALARAAKALMLSDPAKGERASHQALAAAAAIAMPYERGKALCLLAGRAALLGREPAERILALIPDNQYFLQSEARVAMVLFQARRDFAGAVKRAGKIRDSSLKAMALARLAAIRLPRRQEQGKKLFRRVFALCGKGGTRLDPALWEPAWEVFTAREALGLAEGLGGDAYRARVLSQLAAVLQARGETAAAKWSLFIAGKAIKSLEGKQTLDKVALLGDMGREWSVLEVDRARRFFELGAEAARKLK